MLEKKQPVRNLNLPIEWLNKQFAIEYHLKLSHLFLNNKKTRTSLDKLIANHSVPVTESSVSIQLLYVRLCTIWDMWTSKYWQDLSLDSFGGLSVLSAKEKDVLRRNLSASGRNVSHDKVHVNVYLSDIRLESHSLCSEGDNCGQTVLIHPIVSSMACF